MKQVDLALRKLLLVCLETSSNLEKTPGIPINQSAEHLRLITGNSAGSDAIARDLARELGIPLSILGIDGHGDSDQHRDATSVFLPQPNQTRIGGTDAVVAARDHVALAYSDVLLAVWDGEEPAGFSGGTVRLVRDAILWGRPVAVIGRDGSVRIVDFLKTDDVVVRGLSSDDADIDLIRELLVPYSPEQFREDIKRVFLSNSAQAYLKKRDPARHLFLRDNYREHHAAARHAGRIDKLFVGLFSEGSIKPAWLWNALKPWYGVSIEETSSLQPFPTVEPPQLRCEFERYDVAANVAAGKHRDTSWIIYLSSAVAVFSAVAGAIHLGGDLSALIWGSTELLAILAIISLFYWSRKKDWHGDWLSNRYIAEMIRYARMCEPVLAIPDVLKMPLYRIAESPSDGRTFVLASPELWVVRRLIIDGGLPRERAGDVYRPALHLTTLADYVEHILNGQIEFHQSAERRNHRAAHHIHRITSIFFVLTGLSVVAHFVFHATWWLLFTAALPAFAGALHGLLTQNEFEKLGALSGSLARELSALRSAIHVLRLGSLDKSQVWYRLQGLTAEAARAMSGSARQWQELVEHRGAVLPA